MTDGCGYINTAALKQLCKIFGWDVCPTAIQCRISGAKVCCDHRQLFEALKCHQGLLIQHPENDSAVPCVWLRPSQMKINYHPDASPSKAQVTLDVLRSSHLHTPSRL